MIEIPRRRFLASVIGLIAAPAIVKATSLMPVKTINPLDWDDIVAKTLNNRSKELADNISKNNALLQVLRYPADESFTWYSGYEGLFGES